MWRAPKTQLATAGWPAAAYAASSLADAHAKRATFVTDDAMAMIADPRIEVIVEATGIPGAGIAHCLAAIANGKHIVMVNVEADAVAGPLLARKAKSGRRRLFARLGRPAGADLRAGRLGARRRLQGDRRRQGHALRAALSPVEPGQCLGHPRQISQHHRPQFDQSEDVQFLRRRHQVRHRDDGGVQRHRPRAAVGRPAFPAGDALRARRHLQAEEPTAARWRRKASPR